MENEEHIDEAMLLAYLNRELSNEDMIRVDRWLVKSSENMKTFNDIRDTWKMAGTLKTGSVNVDTDKAWNKVLGRIDTGQQQAVPVNAAKRSRIFVAAAAMIVLLIGGMAMFILQEGNVNNGKLELSAGNEVINDRLPDGSEITLNKNSVLSYPPQFDDDERRVSLKGEAFFDIERNEEKPFVIDLHYDFYVKVLGTSFNIRANDEDEVTEVFVNSGKVEFGSESDKIILTKGEKGIMDNKTGRVEKVTDEVHAMKEMFWMDESLDFDGIPFYEVQEIMNALFVDKLFIQCDLIRGEPVNSSFRKGESVKVFLDRLIDADYKFQYQEKVTDRGKAYYLECI